MEANNKTEWIDEYLDGNLSGEELKRFEETLLSDSEFEKEVKAQRMVRDSFERAEKLEYFNQIKENAQSDPPVKRLFQTFGFKLSIAASLILMIGLSLFILNQKSTNDFENPEFLAQSFTLEVLSAEGFRSDKTEIEVQTIESEKFKYHYVFFKGILKLYLENSNLTSKDIKIYYDAFAELPYEIEIDGNRYILEEMEEVEPKPLKKKSE